MDMSDLSFPLSFSPEIRKLQKMAGASIPGMREILGAAERCSEGGFIPGELGVVSNVIPYSHPFHQTPLLPVAIDYPAALALRQMALVQDDLPKYLLAPEVSALLHYVPDLHHKMLLATLWNTGARINEALALTRGIFAGPALPLCAAGHAQAACRKSRKNGRTKSGWQSGSPPGSFVRYAVRQPAADDGGHAENSAGAQEQTHRPDGKGPHLGNHRPHGQDVGQ